MGKQSIAPGTNGKYFYEAFGTKAKARTRLTLMSGEQVWVTRLGKNDGAATAALRMGVRDRLQQEIDESAAAATAALAKSQKTVGEFAQEWLDCLDNNPDQPLAPRSIQNYRSIANKHLMSSDLATIPVASLHATDVKNWLRGIPGHGATASASTVIKNVLDCALDARLVTRNVARDLPQRKKFSKRGQKKAMQLIADSTGTELLGRNHIRSLREDEVARLLIAAYRDPRSTPFRLAKVRPQTRKGSGSKDVADLIAFMLGTGLRIGETLAVRWCDITAGPVLLGEPTTHVTVTGNMSRITGAGLVRDDPKTDESEREILAGPAVVRMLMRRRTYLGLDANSEMPVFAAPGRWATSGGTQFRDPSNVNKDIRRILDSPSVDLGWATPHTFRRTDITTYYEKTGDIKMAADRAGHVNAAMTMRVYLGHKAVASGDRAATAVGYRTEVAR